EGMAKRKHGAGSDALEAEFFADVPRTGLFRMLIPSNQAARQKIGDRLVQAGLYKRESYGLYVVAKGLLMVGHGVLGFLAGTAGVVAPSTGLLLGGLVALFGTVMPSFWLDALLRQRQAALRRALPDALDVIIICLEGGLTLPAAFAKVASDLRTVHPM